MAKEIRLNDKWWYGKHKGRSIKEIIDCDRAFLEDLVFKGKITFHEKVQDYINGGGYRYAKSGYYRPEEDNNWWQPVANVPGVERQNPDPHAQQDDEAEEWEQPAGNGGSVVGEIGLDLTGSHPVWYNGSTQGTYTTSSNSSSTTYISVDTLMGNNTTLG